MTNFLGLLSRKLKNQNEDFVFLTTLQGYDTAFSWTTTFIEEIL